MLSGAPAPTSDQTEVSTGEVEKMKLLCLAIGHEETLLIEEQGRSPDRAEGLRSVFPRTADGG